MWTFYIFILLLSFGKPEIDTTGFYLPDGTFIHENVVNVEAEKMKGLLVFVHGLGAHCERYEEYIQFFVDRGYSVYSFDVRGMGISDPQGRENKIQVDKFETYVEDLAYILNHRVENHGKPIFISGESFGTFQIHLLELMKGLKAVNPDVKGFISIATAIHLVGVNKPTELISNLLMPILAYFFPDKILIDPGLSIEGMTRIKREQKRVLEDDRMVFQGAKNNWGNEFLWKYYYLQKNLVKMEIPVLYVHAGRDREIPLEVFEKKIFALSGSKDKSKLVYQEMMHDMIHDYGKERMFWDIIKWMGERNPLDDTEYVFDGVEEVPPESQEGDKTKVEESEL